MKAPYTYAPGEWGTLAREWRRSLDADNKSPNTVRIYLHAVRQLGDWASSQPTPVEPTTIKAQDIRDYMRHLLDRASAGNAHNHYRSLRTFFTWLVDEEELDRSPMERTRAPQVPEKQVPIITIDQMRALLDACKGKDFADRRDAAILRVLWDTGSRRAEVSYLNVDDLDLDTEAILVHGKGRRSRVIPIGAKTSQALSRYLRVRSRQQQAALPAL